jgi:transcription termination factor Rho
MSGSAGRGSDRAGRHPMDRHDNRGPGGAAGRDKRRALEDLFRLLQRGTSVDPHERIRLEIEPEGISMRAMDLITPIGKGQRCLIVSPPKAGKTMLLMDVARSVERNHPEISVYALLVDERPEEVTHFRRGVKAKVYAASSDLSASEHVDRAEEAMTDILEHVLAGEDVLLLLDSITRLARAYNNVLEGTGRTLTGGLDAATMQAPRQVFGAARKIEEGGSLTILGTALVDTGSRMDEVIFQEFKGTGNTELVLSRELFERRIFPCIDIGKSGSRKEEKLVPPALLPRLHMLRRVLAGKKTEEAMTGLLGLLQKYRTNEEMLQSLA